MKDRIKARHLGLLFTSIFIILISVIVCCCFWADPGTKMIVDNQTEQEVYFFIDGGREVTIPPHKMIEFETISIYPNPSVYGEDEKFVIVAKTKEGEVVYSENYTWCELDDMDWTIVIIPETSD